MSPQILKNPRRTEKTSYEDYSLMELIAEMTLLGTNPKSLLEIAANDILDRHGAKGISYVKQKLDEVIISQDVSGIYLWQELFNLLNNRSSSAYFTIH